MPTNRPKHYLFQKQTRSLSEKIFEKGFNAAAYVLFAVKEGGENFLRALPDSYPSFKLMKALFGVGYKKQHFKPSTIRSSLCRLREQGLIEKDPKEKTFTLTEKGKKLTTYIENRYLLLNKPWDGDLRLVSFDIPENQKFWREAIRQELTAFQFYQLQKSVYIGKHPLPESFYQEITDGGVREHIFIFTIKEADRKEEIIKLLEGN